MNNKTISYICNFACIQEQNIEGTYIVPQKTKKCPKGFSSIQVMALSIIKSYSGILSYWQLTELINTAYQQKLKETAVRGAFERLYKHEFVTREHIRKGSIQGNKYSLKSNPCPYIKKLNIVTSIKDATMQPKMETFVQSVEQNNRSASVENTSIKKEETVNE